MVVIMHTHLFILLHFLQNAPSLLASPAPSAWRRSIRPPLPPMTQKAGAAFAPKTALILGGTGQVGGKLLRELIDSNTFTRIGEFGRRTTPLDTLPASAQDKLVQKVIDFEHLEDAGLKDEQWDVVFIAMGTSRKNAGSFEAFVRIDREYVINAAKAARSDKHPQRLVYVSTFNADVNAWLPYFKSKGITEDGLASIGYDDTIVFRPGFLAGTNRPKFRLGEAIALAIARVLTMIGIPGYRIEITTLATSLVRAGKLGSAGLPAEVKATQVGRDDARYALVKSVGAEELAKDSHSPCTGGSEEL
ncbi:Oxidoreductase HTATIP2 [Mycena sanguinolenta]|uniref:Oxidoreductase HTATIP2 n=1 Tax=Mycena sanguinolenta TaxID=230812 RepID=A0A8H6Z1P3_9AGAR|nr:Oxidoreductase HTATIP2 [Mycena sanguinolenta]